MSESKFNILLNRINHPGILGLVGYGRSDYILCGYICKICNNPLDDKCWSQPVLYKYYNYHKQCKKHLLQKILIPDLSNIVFEYL